MQIIIASKQKGVTLVELTVVISVILILVSTGTVGISFWQDWQKGLQAGEDLKAVYQAQKLYLADNPTTRVSNLSNSNLIPYLPNGMTAVPSITTLDGQTRNIDVTQSPPVIQGFTDPTGPGDSVWDAGK